MVTPVVAVVGHAPVPLPPTLLNHKPSIASPTRTLMLALLVMPCHLGTNAAGRVKTFQKYHSNIIRAAAGHALAPWFQRCCNTTFHYKPTLLLAAASDAFGNVVPCTNASLLPLLAGKAPLTC